ncbi:unnamed protein product [Auanema sp. JU1783]|nr:unnamed protein product [Auanema sp. JU1783]
MLAGCMHKNGLPDNELFSRIHDIVAIANCSMLLFSLFIILRSPKSKESKAYRYMAFSQYGVLFALSMIWSLVTKYNVDVKYGVAYTEGVLVFTNFNGGQVYVILIFIFGMFLVLLQTAYLFRLRVIAHQNHFVQNSRTFYGYIVVITVCLAICSPFTFLFAYVSDVTAEGNPISTFSQQEIEFLMSRRVIWYPYNRITSYPYFLSFGSSLVCTSLVLFYLSWEIVSEIKKKEITSSTTTLRYYKRVWVSLTIQTLGTLIIMIPAPLAAFIELVLPVNMCITQTAVCFFGCCFGVNATLLLLLNANYRQTVTGLLIETAVSKTTSQFVKMKSRVNPH